MTIDDLLQRAVEGGAVPGVVVAAGNGAGTWFEHACGTLSAHGTAPARPNTVMRIASLTKVITSVAALQLVERSALRLDQPVAEILPAFGALPVLEGFDGDRPRLRAPKHHATIMQLLTHTSGLGYWFSNRDVQRYHEVSGIQDPTACRRSVLDMPLVADPGTRWEYGTSTDWLGQVVEAVAGTDLGSYLDEHVTGPLAMDDTTFRPTVAQRARMMALHLRGADGALLVAEDGAVEPEFLSGAGGAVGTAPDFLRLLRALLRGGELDRERILRPATVDLAFRDHLGELTLPAVLPSVLPDLALQTTWPTVRRGFGLGLHLVLEDLPARRRAGAGDWAGLFNCFFWIDRASDLAGVFFTQVLPFQDSRVAGAYADFENAVYRTHHANSA